MNRGAKAEELASRLLWDGKLRQAAATFLAAAHEEGIVAAPLKGIVTSALLYDDPIERVFGDADVLVRRSDVKRVVDLASKRGYRLVFDSRQLHNVNVVVPPGLPIDVRASIGPPGLAREDGADLLSRARRMVDPRVVSCPFVMLDELDHALYLAVDAVMDKLCFRADVHLEDLRRAAHRFVRSEDAFAERAAQAGVVHFARAAMRWVASSTGDERARAVEAALGRRASPRMDAWSRLLESRMLAAPWSATARVGVRFLADEPWRALFSLALGAYGVARFTARQRGRDPWEGVLWRGPAPRDQPEKNAAIDRQT